MVTRGRADMDHGRTNTDHGRADTDHGRVPRAEGCGGTGAEAARVWSC